MLPILPTMTAEPRDSPAEADGLTDAEYRRRADAVLAAVEAAVDSWLQADIIDIDTQRTGGMLQLGFPDGSQIVLNTQPPLQEIWIAARSGGFHYRLLDGRWCNTRDGSEFFAALSECASRQAGKPLVFTPSGG